MIPYSSNRQHPPAPLGQGKLLNWLQQPAWKRLPQRPFKPHGLQKLKDVTLLLLLSIALIAFIRPAAAQSGQTDGPCSYPPQHFDWSKYKNVSAEMSPPRPGKWSGQPAQPSPENSASGIVVVRLAIGDKGKIEGTEILRSLTCDLDMEALAYLQAYQYSPAIKEGEPVPSQIKVEVSFKNRYPVAAYDGAYHVGNEVSAPRLIKSPDPNYTEAARKAKIEGTVLLWLVVKFARYPGAHHRRKAA